MTEVLQINTKKSMVLRCMEILGGLSFFLVTREVILSAY